MVVQLFVQLGTSLSSQSAVVTRGSQGCGHGLGVKLQGFDREEFSTFPAPFSGRF